MAKGRKEKFVKKESSSSKHLIAMLGLFAAVLVIVVFVYLAGGKHPGSQGNSIYSKGPIEMTSVEPAVADGYVTIPLAEVKARKLASFQYEAVRVPDEKGGETALPLLSYIAPSGRVVTAVSLCEPCKSTTFHTEIDGTLVCNVCGTKWDLENLKSVSGACGDYPPLEIANEVEGDLIRIKEADLLSWKPRG
jgi:uncharacterized membrane protein